MIPQTELHDILKACSLTMGGSLKRPELEGIQLEFHSDGIRFISMADYRTTVIETNVQHNAVYDASFIFPSNHLDNFFNFFPRESLNRVFFRVPPGGTYIALSNDASMKDDISFPEHTLGDWVGDGFPDWRSAVLRRNGAQWPMVINPNFIADAATAVKYFTDREDGLRLESELGRMVKATPRLRNNLTSVTDISIYMLAPQI